MIAPLLLLAWLSGASNPATDEPSTEITFITDVREDPKRCNSGNARLVGFANLAVEPRKLLGQCVQVRGYVHGRAVFAGRADARLRFSQSTDSLDGRRVGLYGLSHVSPAGPPRGGFHTIVGRVGDCEVLAQEATMVMGYCHYTGGPYLAVSELRRGS